MTRLSHARSLLHGLAFSVLALALAVLGIARYVMWFDEQFWSSFFPPGRLPPPAMAAWLLFGAGMMALLALFARSGRLVMGIASVVAVSSAAYVAAGPAAVVLTMAIVALTVVCRTWPRASFNAPRLRAEIFEPPRRRSQ